MDTMDARVQSILEEILAPQDTLISSSHNNWIQRELIKLLHKEMELASNEQVFQKRMERERKKSKPIVNNHASTPNSETPKNG